MVLVLCGLWRPVFVRLLGVPVLGGRGGFGVWKQEHWVICFAVWVGDLVLQGFQRVLRGAAGGLAAVAGFIGLSFGFIWGYEVLRWSVLNK